MANGFRDLLFWIPELCKICRQAIRYVPEGISQNPKFRLCADCWYGPTKTARDIAIQYGISEEELNDHKIFCRYDRFNHIVFSMKSLERSVLWKRE
jgi:hypothetical protein